MIINHNLPALGAYNKLAGNQFQQTRSLEKLSSGLRINRAGDDAAGLAISEKMRSQIRGLSQANRNAQDAISLIQTGEGALTETHSILQRMRELAVQSANDTNTLNDRVEMQKEVDQLKAEINRIANTTEFNTKKLLDGSVAGLTSTDRQTTDVVLNGEVSRFGNFDVSINVMQIGKAQVQKTDIMRTNDMEITSFVKNELYGLSKVELNSSPGQNRPANGSYAVDITAGTGLVEGGGSATINAIYSQKGNTIAGVSFDTGLTGFSLDGSAVWEVVNIVSDTVSFKVTEFYTDRSLSGAAGTNQFTIDLKAGSTNSSYLALIAQSTNNSVNFSKLDIGQLTLTTSSGFTVGDKVNVRVSDIFSGNAAVNGAFVQMRNTSGTGNTGNGQTQYQFIHTTFDGTGTGIAREFYNVVLDTANGSVWEGKFTMTYKGSAYFTAATQSQASSFNITATGKLAPADINTKLSAVDKFTDASGNFLLNSPQTITMYDGSGNSTNVQLYGTDTLGDVRKKLNDAIANGLGMGKLLDDTDITTKDYGHDAFVSYVKSAQSVNTTDTDIEPESLVGTFVIRSAVAGKLGKISFSGDQNLINALSLTTIQADQETQFRIDINDAHTNTTIASGVQISGNKLVGVVDKNVDVIFDANADMKVRWDATGTRTGNLMFGLTADTSNTYKTKIHIANNNLTFHIGANSKQNMTSSIGRMDTTALGLDGMLVINVDTANDAMNRLDRAIAKVSSQRSDLGAAQNRLEHTINNLTVASENLTASESRIRDVDMAKEMMEFSKMNILAQAGTAMLAQANQFPQGVLQLLR